MIATEQIIFVNLTDSSNSLKVYVVWQEAGLTMKKIADCWTYYMCGCMCGVSLLSASAIGNSHPNSTDLTNLLEDQIK